MTRLFAPLGRSLAIASLAGAALIAGSLGPAMAQQKAPDSSPKPPAAAMGALPVAPQPVVMLAATHLRLRFFTVLVLTCFRAL